MADVRKDLRQKFAKAKQKVRDRLRLQAAAEAEKDSADERKPPQVVLGEDFADWVRSRIARQPHPVPAFAYQLELVEQACDHALRITRRRRIAVILLVVGCIVGAVTGTMTASTAALWLALAAG